MAVIWLCIVTNRRGSMFPRKFLSKLEQWADSEDRKPLVVRGARQVGKTMAVKMFGQRFERFI